MKHRTAAAAALALVLGLAAALAPRAVHAAADMNAQWYSDGPLNRSLVCESIGGRERFCAAPVGGAVRIVRTLSSSPCVQGDSWRWDARGVYVRNGCRAQFAYRVNDPWEGGWNDGDRGRGDRYREIRCGIGRGGDEFCPAPNDGRVRLVRQESRTECIEGRTWRAERGGIRVRNGCAGRFGYFESGDGGWGGGPRAEPIEVRCESRNHRWALCPVDIVGPVKLVRQDSRAPCERDWTWGTAGNDGIWVSDGCRARFQVLGRPSGRMSSEGEGGAPPGVRRMDPRERGDVR